MSECATVTSWRVKRGCAWPRLSRRPLSGRAAGRWAPLPDRPVVFRCLRRRPVPRARSVSLAQWPRSQGSLRQWQGRGRGHLYHRVRGEIFAHLRGQQGCCRLRRTGQHGRCCCGTCRRAGKSARRLQQPPRHVHDGLLGGWPFQTMRNGLACSLTKSSCSDHLPPAARGRSARRRTARRAPQPDTRSAVGPHGRAARNRPSRSSRQTISPARSNNSRSAFLPAASNPAFITPVPPFRRSPNLRSAWGQRTGLVSLRSRRCSE